MRLSEGGISSVVVMIPVRQACHKSNHLMKGFIPQAVQSLQESIPQGLSLSLENDMSHKASCRNVWSLCCASSDSYGQGT